MVSLLNVTHAELREEYLLPGSRELPIHYPEGKTEAAELYVGHGSKCMPTCFLVSRGAWILCGFLELTGRKQH